MGSKATKHLVSIAARGAELCGLVDLLELSTAKTAALRVLMYHRIGNPKVDPDMTPGLVSATPEQFGDQMTALAQQYDVVSLDQVLEAVRGGPPLPPRAVLITFDDGYTDFGEYAWPILRHLALPVTLFVPTDYPSEDGYRFWWDRLWRAVRTTEAEELPEFAGSWPTVTAAQRKEAYDRCVGRTYRLRHSEAMMFVDDVCDALGGTLPDARVLNWDELRELSRQGVSLCPHTRSHALMERVSIGQLRSEVAGSITDLVEEVGPVPPVFAYPAGSVNVEARNMLEELGIELAFTTRRGINDLSTDDPLTLRRINVGFGTAWSLIRLQLAGVRGKNKRG